MTRRIEADDAEVVIIAYGCTARAAQAAVRMGRESGLKVGLLQLTSVWPFPRRAVEDVLNSAKAVLVPELNMGQLSREVKRVSRGQVQVQRHSRMDGMVITPEELLNKVRELA